MGKKIIIKPQKCVGCNLCNLTCSVSNYGVFDPQLSHIHIFRHDLYGTFNICFSSTCIGCKQCVRICPSHALQLIDSCESSVYEKEGEYQ